MLRQRIQEPKRKIADLCLKLDDCLERLKASFGSQTVIRKHLLENLGIRLRHESPLLKIKDGQSSVENLKLNIIAKCTAMMEMLKKQIEAHMSLLHSLSPLAVLERGYSIARSLPQGTIIKKARSVLPGDFVDVKVSSGHFQATVTDIFEE
jgi:exodeoxyribonuclease VII large subunit